MTREDTAIAIMERTAKRKAEGLIPTRYDIFPTPDLPPGKTPEPCIHRGRIVPGLERERYSLDLRREWYYCEHLEQPLGPHVCGCKGCGPLCRGYDDGSPPPPEPRRHLAFHIYPHSRQNGLAWRLAVDQLRLRWSLFTGKKVVAICTGDDLDPPEIVRDYLPSDATVIIVPNDPGLREVMTWLPLWYELLPATSDHDVALYCHAKGVTRSVDPGNSTHWWASLAWSLTLDHWPLIKSKLRRRPIVGPFKKVGYGFGGAFGRWHYSGTFFWVNIGDFRQRLTIQVPRMWWGVEAWPGLAYDVADAEFLFLEGQVPSLDLYSPGFWAHTVRPRYTEWLLENRPTWPWIMEPILSVGG